MKFRELHGVFPHQKCRFCKNCYLCRRSHVHYASLHADAWLQRKKKHFIARPYWLRAKTAQEAVCVISSNCKHKQPLKTLYLPMVLSIDTSTATCAIALHASDGTLLASYALHQSKAASAALMQLCDQALSASATERGDLTAIAVALGPGSYTGLRIGLSTAKGLCHALGIPLVGVSTLQAMAAQQQRHLPLAPNDLLVPMLDARRMEVYTAAYLSQLQETLAPQPYVVGAEAFAQLEVANRKLWLFGNGADKCMELLAHRPHLQFVAGIAGCAEGVGYCAHKLLQAGKTADLAYSEPIYLKNAQVKKSTGHKLLRALKNIEK